VDTGTVADFTAPGAEAFVDNTVFGNVLALQGNHTHIAGLDIDGNGTGGQGINVGSNKSADPIAPGTWNIVIDQTDIHDGNWAGIGLEDNNAHVLIFNGTSVTDADFGIFAFNNNTNVQITDVDISNPDGEGIHLRSRNSNVAISDTTIDGAGADGIMLYSENTLTITNTTITDSGIAGISMGTVPFFGLFNGGLNHVTIANSTIDGATEDGLFVIGNRPNTITMTNTTFTGAFGDDVIDIDLAGNTLSGDGNVFDGTAGGSFCEVFSPRNGSFGFTVPVVGTCP